MWTFSVLILMLMATLETLLMLLCKLLIETRSSQKLNPEPRCELSWGQTANPKSTWSSWGRVAPPWKCLVPPPQPPVHHHHHHHYHHQQQHHADCLPPNSLAADEDEYTRDEIWEQMIRQVPSLLPDNEIVITQLVRGLKAFAYDLYGRNHIIP